METYLKQGSWIFCFTLLPVLENILPLQKLDMKDYLNICDLSPQKNYSWMWVMILFSQAIFILGRNIYYSKKFKYLASAVIHEIFLRVLAVIKEKLCTITSSTIFQLLKDDVNAECNSNLLVCSKSSYHFWYSWWVWILVISIAFCFVVPATGQVSIFKMYLNFTWHCISDGG